MQTAGQTKSKMVLAPKSLYLNREKYRLNIDFQIYASDVDFSLFIPKDIVLVFEHHFTKLVDI